MTEFPRIKKRALDFLSDEDGRISQQSLIKMGAFAVGAIGFAGVAEASVTQGTTSDGRVHFLCDDQEDGQTVEVTCLNTGENGDVTMKVGMPEGLRETDCGMEMSMDSCDNAKKQIGNWMAENWDQLVFENAKVTQWQSWEGSNDFPKYIQFIEPYHQHGNSLIITGPGAEINTSHEHSINYCGNDVKLTFSAEQTDCDNDGGCFSFSIISTYKGGEMCRVQLEKCHDV